MPYLLLFTWYMAICLYIGTLSDFEGWSSDILRRVFLVVFVPGFLLYEFLFILAAGNQRDLLKSDTWKEYWHIIKVTWEGPING